MKSRLLVAAVGVPILLVVLLACPKEVTMALMAMLCGIAAWELLHTTGILRHTRMEIYCMIMAALVQVWSYFGCPALPAAICVFVFGLLLFLEALFAYPDVKFEGVTGGLFAGIVIPLCLGSIVRILLLDTGRYLVLVPIMIPFIADAGAYFAGRFLGKHKMAPVLSPKKTVEGAIGGLVTGVLSMMIYGLIMQLAFRFQFNYLYGAVYGVLGSLISIVGDLAFSMVKRETGIKDYGTIFRAHGGVLDRFDSVVFAAPLVELLLILLPVME